MTRKENGKKEVCVVKNCVITESKNFGAVFTVKVVPELLNDEYKVKTRHIKSINGWLDSLEAMNETKNLARDFDLI